MIKYVVKTEKFEFNPAKFKSASEAFFAYDDHNCKEICLFDTLEEARRLLDTINVQTIRYGYRLASADVAFIECGDWEYDEDENKWIFISGCDIWDFKYEELTTEDEEEEDDG